MSQSGEQHHFTVEGPGESPHPPFLPGPLSDEDAQWLAQCLHAPSKEAMRLWAEELKKSGWGFGWDGTTLYMDALPGRVSQTQPGLVKKLPIIGDAFATGEATIWTALPFQAYPQAASNAASGATRWMEEQMGEHAFRASYTVRKPSGTTTISLISPTDELNAQAARESIWRQVRGMGDLDGDVYLAFIAQLAKSRNTREKDGWTWIAASHILDYRGIRPRIDRTESGKEYRAGHRQEDLEDIWRCVRRMYNARITVDQAIFEEPQPGRSKRKGTKTVRYTRESPLFQWGQVLTRQELWPYQEGMVAPKMEVAWQVKESAWMEPFIQGTNQMTGEMLQSCLHYDIYHEIWEKRLSRYVMFHLTMNRHSSSITRQIGALIEELSLGVDERHPIRTKDRFEKALERLRQDGHVSRWRYKEEVNLQARGWLGTWLTQEIILERPVIVDAPSDQDKHYVK